MRALSVFDFSQNLATAWEGSNSEARREILDCVSLNRTVTDTTLCVTKRKPFDYLAERPFLKNGDGYQPLHQHPIPSWIRGWRRPKAGNPPACF